jgi:hypothetical protein
VARLILDFLDGRRWLKLPFATSQEKQRAVGRDTFVVVEHKYDVKNSFSQPIP